jgi:hypothetical protein
MHKEGNHNEGKDADDVYVGAKDEGYACRSYDKNMNY